MSKPRHIKKTRITTKSLLPYLALLILLLALPVWALTVSRRLQNRFPTEHLNGWRESAKDSIVSGDPSPGHERKMDHYFNPEFSIGLQYPNEFTKYENVVQWSGEETIIILDYRGPDQIDGTEKFDGATISFMKPQKYENDFNEWVSARFEKEKATEGPYQHFGDSVNKETIGSHTYLKYKICLWAGCGFRYFADYDGMVYEIHTDIASQGSGKRFLNYDALVRKVMISIYFGEEK